MEFMKSFMDQSAIAMMGEIVLSSSFFRILKNAI
jgi:hypothetical protein